MEASEDSDDQSFSLGPPPVVPVLAQQDVLAEAIRILHEMFEKHGAVDVVSLFRACTDESVRIVEEQKRVARELEAELRKQAKAMAKAAAAEAKATAAAAAAEAQALEKMKAEEAKAVAAAAAALAKAEKDAKAAELKEQRRREQEEKERRRVEQQEEERRRKAEQEEEERRTQAERAEEARKKREEQEEEARKKREEQEEEARKKREERRDSAASNISKDRLERATRRLSLNGLMGGGGGGPKPGTGQDSKRPDSKRPDSKRLESKRSKHRPLREWMPDPRAPKLAEDWRGGAAMAEPMDACVSWPPQGDFAYADCLAADDDTLVCMGSDGMPSTLATYSALHGADLCLLGHRRAIVSVAMNGELIASGARDLSVRLWSRSTGECEAVLERTCVGSPLGLALSTDSLLCGEDLGDPTLGRGAALPQATAGLARARLWSLRELLLSEGRAEAQCEFLEHTAPICGAALSEHFAMSAGSTDLSARVWPLDGRERVESVAALMHPADVCSVSIVFASTLAATGCADGKIWLWSLSSFVCMRTLEHSGAHSLAPVSCVRLHSGMLLSGGEDGHVKLWALAAADGGDEAVLTLPGKTPVQGLAFSSLAGFIAVAAGDTLQVWRPKGGAEKQKERRRSAVGADLLDANGIR